MFTSSDAPSDVVVRQLVLELANQTIGFDGIERLANEPLQLVKELLTDLTVGNARNLDVLHRVAGVDVLGEFLAVADARYQKDHAHAPIRPGDITDGGDNVGMLVFDARGDRVQPFPVERLARERGDLLLQPGTELVERQARDLRGFNDGAVWNDRVLSVRRQRRGQQGK